MTKIVHKLIAKTAKEMCNEVFEACSYNDVFHRLNPSRTRFVAKNWKRFIGHTRQAFAQMLADPSYPEHLKAEIYEAMLIDSAYKVPPPLDMRKLQMDAGIDPDEKGRNGHTVRLH